MPNWAIHLIVPFLALIMVGRKKDYKYILLLLPLAVLPDIDTFVTEHRALLHNIFIPAIDASLEMSKTNQLSWTFDYGFSSYSENWKIAYGYISDSVGTGSLVFVLAAGIWAAYRNRIFEKENE